MTPRDATPYDPETATVNPADHVRLATWIVTRHYRHARNHAEDLVQDALESFTRSARTYDPARSSFASWAVRMARRYLDAYAARYILPGRAGDNLARAAWIGSRSLFFGQSFEEVARRYPHARPDTLAALHAAVQDAAFPIPDTSDDPEVPSKREAVASEDPDPETAYVRAERDAAVRARLDAFAEGLGARERLVLAHLRADDGETLTELADRIRDLEGLPSLSRERARQLTERMKTRLRALLADFA